MRSRGENAGRPALTLIVGGRPEKTRRAPRRRVETDRVQISVREVMRQHAVRGGWWECVVDDRAELVLMAMVPDGCVNTFVLADIDLDGDGACFAHDIGLPREVWDPSAGRGVV